MISLDEDKQAIVMGLGRFGGGLGATRYLLGRGMRVIVTDNAHEAELAVPVGALRDEFSSDRITFALGGHEQVPINDCDMLVVNPAVPEPWNNTFLHKATEAGLLICTEIELLLDRLSAIGQNQLIAVTGSAGKSTTCSMIAHLARRSGRACLLGGNIGGSLLDHSDADLLDAEAIVLELSSFMLHWIGQGLVTFEPEVGVLTSLDENHIDWHGSMEHYITSKSMIRRSRQFIPPIDEHAISGSVNSLESDSMMEPGGPRRMTGFMGRERRFLSRSARHFQVITRRRTPRRHVWHCPRFFQMMGTDPVSPDRLYPSSKISKALIIG